MPAIKMPDIDFCEFVMDGLEAVGYQRNNSDRPDGATWRVSPTPLVLSREDIAWLRMLGPHLNRFTTSSSDLYLESIVGRQPGWIAQYIDRGKPPALVDYQRMRRMRRQRPTVIRPDVIPTPNGMMITELDSVPGGMGITARLAELYSGLGFKMLSDDLTLPEAFAKIVAAASNVPTPRLAIVVSNESEAYRAEMNWLGHTLSRYGIQAVTVKPHELWYSENGVFLEPSTSSADCVNVIYRFFELFDLPNIPKIELLMFLNKKKAVEVIPPFRPLFEEKMWLALLHHPMLSSYWRQALGDESYAFLTECFPSTWIIDPTAIPAHATIPGLNVNGGAVNAWEQLRNLGRSERQLVIKPSGFSELAWGSRGVLVGHDVSTTEWNLALDNALQSFPKTPYVLQEFHTGRHFEGRFYDADAGCIRTMPCRARLCPYYFVIGDEVKLAAVLATLCPLDKKKIHGMPEAILVPCAMEEADVAHFSRCVDSTPTSLSHQSILEIEGSNV